MDTVRTLVSAFVAVTVVPGMLAPDGSTALPVIEAVIVWASAEFTSRNNAVSARSRCLCIMLVSLIFNIMDSWIGSSSLLSYSSKPHRNP